jgi:hypothetical protein
MRGNLSFCGVENDDDDGDDATSVTTVAVNAMAAATGMRGDPFVSVSVRMRSVSSMLVSVLSCHDCYHQMYIIAFSLTIMTSC